MTTIAPLQSGDFESWRQLAGAYESFYKTRRRADEFARLWARLFSDSRLSALGAYDDGRLIGFAHYLFHAVCWRADVCYLQDLFVAPAHRRRGAGRALIEAVIDDAHRRGASRVYWHTQSRNRVARRLYDELASYSGFVRYERELRDARRSAPGAG